VAQDRHDDTLGLAVAGQQNSNLDPGSEGNVFSGGRGGQSNPIAYDQS